MHFTPKALNASLVIGPLVVYDATRQPEIATPDMGEVNQAEAQRLGAMISDTKEAPAP